MPKAHEFITAFRPDRAVVHNVVMPVTLINFAATRGYGKSLPCERWPQVLNMTLRVDGRTVVKRMVQHMDKLLSNPGRMDSRAISY